MALPPSGSQRTGAIQWFRNTVRLIRAVVSGGKASSYNPETNSELFGTISPFQVGEMFIFLYDPKTKEQLPYWDTFPLIFPIEFYSDGFLGINLHYLPYVYRQRLMNSLKTLASDNKYTAQTKLQISYRILKGSSSFKGFKPCVKRYLFSHVRSSFMKISAENWDRVILLPLERFTPVSKDQVFNDSRKNL